MDNTKGTTGIVVDIEVFTLMRKAIEQTYAITGELLETSDISPLLRSKVDTLHYIMGEFLKGKIVDS